jgi:hypothetical protein
MTNDKRNRGIGYKGRWAPACAEVPAVPEAGMQAGRAWIRRYLETEGLRDLWKFSNSIFRDVKTYYQV